MDELLSEFLGETSESLALLDTEIVNLEKNPNDQELLSNIFRIVHTIKGTCGFLGLPRLESIAHASENILSKYRDKEIDVTAEGISAILESLDLIKDILAALEETQAEPQGDDKDLISRLNELADGGGEMGDIPDPDQIEQLVENVKVELSNAENAECENNIADMPTEVNAEEPAPEVKVEEAPKAAAKTEKVEKAGPVATVQNIRVSVDLLENLMTRVGELVLARNQLLQMVRGNSESKFHAPLQRLNQVTSELQENVMKTRMQPIGTAWSKLPRIIRDLSQDLGKKIELVKSGEDTELDRQVIEIIKDPLTHMVRNSADHGLETPEERVAAGKKDVGTVNLNAYHEGGHIIIEIIDDGKGINVARVKQKAIENGLITEEKAESLSHKDLLQYVFKPGFSTAEKVTNVSGRGVGMDVVRTNIEKIGGNIELDSTEGVGTKCTIKIPLTLAIVSALVVESGTQKFAIPQINVTELVKANKDSGNKIEYIEDTPVLRLRNRLLPLVNLSDVLSINCESTKTFEEQYIVVTQVGPNYFGVIVDQIFDTEEIVVKPLSPILKDISVFSGNTILGDGSVIMILDPNGMAGFVGDISANETLNEKQDDAVHNAQNDKISFVLFKGGENNNPKSVPLDQISRLEVIPTSDIELSNEVLMVQYRDRLMPLITIDGYQFDPDRDMQSVIVFAQDDNFIGLMVDEIIDIIEDRLDVKLTSTVDGYIGTAVLNERATDLIDVSYYLSQVCPSWFGSISQKVMMKDKITIPKKVLLIDDSLFFRNLLTPVLSYAGYDVTSVSGGQQAIHLYDKGYDFDVIISDIEMPDMNGFEFAKTVRDMDGKWQSIPIFALSAHKTEKNVNKSKEAGFDDFISKCDKDQLLETISSNIELRG